MNGVSVIRGMRSALHAPSCQFVLLLLLQASLSRPAHALWPTNPNNGGVPLSRFAFNQMFPSAAADGAGGVIVSWEDFRPETTSDIYAQRVTLTGDTFWSTDGIPICTAPDAQYYPYTVADGTGGAIITWIDFRGGNWDVYAQRVDAGGSPRWTGNGVALCTAGQDQTFNPHAKPIASDGAGGAIVTWNDARGGTSHIYAQRVNFLGVPQWAGNGISMCSADSRQEKPVIVSDEAGGAIIAWDDFRSGATGVYAQRVNAAGVTQWPTDGIPIGTYASGSQFMPDIVPDGAGGAVITWSPSTNGTVHAFYAQRVDASGTPQWTANGVAVCTTAVSQNAGGQIIPTAASDGAGGVIVTWHDFRNGINNDIYAQRIASLGTPQWTGGGVAVSAAMRDQFFPIIVADGAGGAIVAWGDGRNSTRPDIYAQRIDGTGAPLWTGNGVALCIAPADQYTDFYSQPIVSDGAGGAIVAWPDFRSGMNLDIYAQRVSGSGTLPPVGVTSVAPSSFELLPGGSNPGPGGATVVVALPHATRLRAEVFDVSGRVLAVLTDSPFEAGRHRLVWNGQGPGGAASPAGVYFVRAQAGLEIRVRAVVLVR